MEPKEFMETKQDRGAVKLIWGLSILLCVALIAFVMVGGGFLRIARIRSAAARVPAEAQPRSVAPAATPVPTMSVEMPLSIQVENTPQPAEAPEAAAELPELALDVQPSDQMQVFASIPDVVEKASASVVGIIQYQPNARTGKLAEYGGGSGFIVSEDGYILTNAHVVSGAAAVEVLFNSGDRMAARVIGADVSSDVAVLKIDAEGLPALPIGDSTALRVGEYVIAIGNPINTYELYGTVTFGIISAKAREINIDGYVNTYLQTDAAINFGNSGGPLINMAGQVIGMSAAKSITAGYDSLGNAVSAEGIGFALPIQNVIDIANVILQEGGVVRPGIGVTIRAVDELTALENEVPVGCRIEELIEGAPAELAGLQVGDIITRADSIEVTVNDDVVDYLRSKQVGDTVEFTVYRDGGYVKIAVVVGDMNKFN